MSEDRSRASGVVVLGGGIAGLAAAYYLGRAGHRVTVLERAPVTGGMCASFESHGFTLDHGPHKLYSVIPGILSEIRRIMGDELLEHEKKNRIRLLGRYMNYPLSMKNLVPLLGPARTVELGVGYAGAVLRGLVDGAEASSYEAYILSRFGRGVYELVFEPLAWKVWGDPKTLSADLAKARIPSGGATELILRLLKIRESTPDVDAPFFYYPRRGFGAWPEKLAEEVRRQGGAVKTGVEIRGLERRSGRVVGVDIDRSGRRERVPCGLLVSSIPIQSLARLLHPEDETVQTEARRLRFRNLALVYLILDRARIMDDHWVFFPERRYPFNRVFEQKAMNEELGPPSKTALCCDLTCDEDDDTWKATDDELGKRSMSALVEAGLVRPEWLEVSFVRRFRDFYPVYSIDYRERLGGVYDRLRATENLILTGRLGMFNYNNSDHCLDMGRFIATGLTEGREPSEIWGDLEDRVREYRIVD